MQIVFVLIRGVPSDGDHHHFVFTKEESVGKKTQTQSLQLQVTLSQLSNYREIEMEGMMGG